MRQVGARDATFVISKPPRTSSRLLPRILPKGSQLRVPAPGGIDSGGGDVGLTYAPLAPKGERRHELARGATYPKPLSCRHDRVTAPTRHCPVPQVPASPRRRGKAVRVLRPRPHPRGARDARLRG